MILGGTQRVGVGVTYVVHVRGATVEEVRQDRSSLERVVDDRALRPHDAFEDTGKAGAVSNPQIYRLDMSA